MKPYINSLKFNRFVVTLGLCICGVLIGPVQTNAAITISPIEGGTSLQFSSQDVLSQTGREIRVRVTSSGGQQYQVFQRWIQPLSSNMGGFPGRDVLRFYGLSGSNGSGTLYGHVPEYIGMTDQLVYTSSPSGMGDSFTLVYQIDPDRLNVSGQLTGRLMLILRPIGSGEVEDAFLDVLVDADLGLDIAVSGDRGIQAIRLNTRAPDEYTDIVRFVINGNAGPLRIYQEILNPIVSLEDQTPLPKGALRVSGSGYTDGVKFTGSADVDGNRTLIYESQRREDEWALQYELASSDLTPLKAGTYQGRIRYEIESGQIQKSFDFDVDIRVEPVFELSFTFPDGPVAFSKIFPGSGPQERSVLVTVDSNLQKPYVVSQKTPGRLRNEHGNTLESGYFMLKTTAPDELKGGLKFPEFTPVSIEDEQTLFISDRQGSPAEFNVFYRLVPYSDMSPGHYQTEITYSLGEI